MDASVDPSVAIEAEAGSTRDASRDAHVAYDAALVTDSSARAEDAPVWSGPSRRWELVAADRVREICKLDPAALEAADKILNVPWAIVRYGKLCHQFNAEGMAPAEAWSTTKTLGALVAGAVAYQTRSLAVTGHKTGPLSDEDRVDHWLDAFSYNKDAHVAHVLAMVAQNVSLGWGDKQMVYDVIGTTQINSLSDILTAAIQQETTRLGMDLEQFTQTFLFQKLQLENSTWSDGAPSKIFAYSWVTDVYDMAKVGLLMLRGGVWQGERILAADWIYRMTRPSFEDANTGYGYLTWLNAASNYNYGNVPLTPPPPAGSTIACAPVALWNHYPHGLSQSPDCHYQEPYTCDQQFDVGEWQAVGINGQVIQGHPGLDLLLVARDLTPLSSGAEAPAMLWNAVKPAVINADPTFAGDEAAFCASYGANRYAPDLGALQ